MCVEEERRHTMRVTPTVVLDRELSGETLVVDRTSGKRRKLELSDGQLVDFYPRVYPLAKVFGERTLSDLERLRERRSIELALVIKGHKERKLREGTHTAKKLKARKSQASASKLRQTALKNKAADSGFSLSDLLEL
jgi:hypothetical protein